MHRCFFFGGGVTGEKTSDLIQTLGDLVSGLWMTSVISDAKSDVLQEFG